MKVTTVLTLTSLLFVGIAGQARATNPQSMDLLELANHKYMMSANVMNNPASKPGTGNGPRFADSLITNSEDNSIFLRRGSGRKDAQVR
ncbi:MAG: hypothetical protein ACOVQ7_08465 [Limnoraphis robusta]|jgi:hypothetical protein